MLPFIEFAMIHISKKKGGQRLLPIHLFLSYII